MQPLPGDPQEVEGVLNPASARGPDGDLYLFPRLVARGNFSRIGRARVIFGKSGKPSGVERLGVVLEPDEAWEQNPVTAGVEDPRIVFIAGLRTYVMTYAAYGPLGPRIGLAVSPDLVEWQRLGPVSFAYEPSLKTNLNPNTPDVGLPLPAGVTDPRQSIWISFVAADLVDRDVRALIRLDQHHQVAQPQQPWEATKIGGGTPPIRVPEGWLIIHHGVTKGEAPPGGRVPVRYVAGAMVLDPEDVRRVLSRSERPLLEPETKEER